MKTIKFDNQDLKNSTDSKYEMIKLSAITKALESEGFDYSEYVGHYLNGSNQYQFINTKLHKSFFVMYSEETGDIVFGYHDKEKFIFNRNLSVRECIEKDDLNPV